VKKKLDMTSFKKFWIMLTPPQRRAGIILLGLMLIGMALETLGIGLILPILGLMAKGDLSSYPFLKPWLDRLGNPHHEHLVLYSLIMLVGIYGIKVTVIAFLNWRQAAFLSGMKASLSMRLFTGYLHQPYAFHLQRNSAELIRNAISQVAQFTSTTTNAMTLIAESLVLFGVVSLMIYMEPVGSVFVTGLFTLVSWAFYSFNKKRLEKWGNEFQLHEALRIQYLQEGLGASKDVKLLGREKEFLNRYGFHSLNSARIEKWLLFLQGLPRLMFEFLTVSGIALIVLIMIIPENKPMDSLVPTLGLFAACAFRLMPSVNRIMSSINGMRFNWPVFRNLYDEFSLFAECASTKKYLPLNFKKSLVLEDVSFSYESMKVFALKNTSISIGKGMSVGFIGSTGAGKSTLVDIVLGLLAPVSGVIKVDGVDIQTNLRGWQDHIGYVPQSIFLTDDTIRHNIAFGISHSQIEESVIWSSLRAAQLEQFVKGLPEGINTKIGEAGVRLSGGQRQRIGIARALYHNPSVLVLDEATSALDNATESDFMKAVSSLKRDKTLIIVAHRLTTVEHCDYLFRLENGEIVEEGKVSKLLDKQS
jgi:ATP-binding cassette, subfamily B, bacterial PglK